MYASCVYWRQVWTDSLSAAGSAHRFRNHVESDKVVFDARLRRLRGQRFIRPDVSGTSRSGGR